MGSGHIVIDGNVDAFGDLEGGEVLFGFCKCRAKRADLQGKLCCGRTTGTKEAVAVAQRTAHRCRMMATDPERRVRLLEGFGLHHGTLELPEATAEGDARLGPAGLHQLQSFREASDEAGRINLEGGEHSPPSSGSNTDLEAPTTELIERADALGEVDRIVQWAAGDGASP